MANKTTRMLKSFKKNIPRHQEVRTPIARDMFLPNHSGDHSRGMVRNTPVNPTDIVNKEYVDAQVVNTGIDLFAYDSASDTGSYKQFKLEPSAGAEVEGDVSIAGDAVGQSVGARITEVGIDCPAVINTLTAGIYNFHIHMKAATAGRITFYAEIYVRHADTSETLITTTVATDPIGTAQMGHDTHATVTTDYPLTTDDRIVVKGYANNSSPAATTLYIYVEGDTATRVSLRALSAPRTHDSLAGVTADQHHNQVFEPSTDTDYIEPIDSKQIRVDRADSTKPAIEVGTTGVVIASVYPTMAATANADSIQTMQFQNSNTGTSADMRFITVADDDAYCLYSSPSSNNTGVFVGQTKSDCHFILTSNQQPRHLVIGTFGAKDIIFSRQNAEKARLNATSFNIPTGSTFNINGTAHTHTHASTTGQGVDDHHNESHTIASHSDTSVTGAELTAAEAASHTQNTDTALGSGAVAADHGTAATDQIINVAYGTGAAPTANTTTIGSLYVTYTA